MKSLLKRRKSIDRISHLPDCLISHILSFLPTKDAVRTSVLSTQWINQWTSITRLDFEECCPTDIGNSNELSFLNFVNRVLLCNVTRIDSFRLKTQRDYDVAHVNLWLSAALSRHVRQIDLSVPIEPIAFFWPPLEPKPHDCLFSSRNLVILKLGMGFLLEVPDTFSLNSLKILHLNSVEFEDSESLARLVSSCPVLEELKMKGEVGQFMDVLSISSLVLKRLILNGLYDDTDFYPYKVVLNTPCLQYFEHVDEGVPEGYLVEMKTLHSLDRAHLCVHINFEQYDQHDNMGILEKSMADLAVAISNVQFLYLSEYAFQAFYHMDFVMPLELPKFPRLTDLKIGDIARDEGMSLLVAFLQASPQLASLSFSVDDEYIFMDWDTPTAVPFCMQHNLKVIEVKYFTGRPLELSMIEYFLGKTISLEKLIISAFPERNLAIIKKLLKLPKASKSCKVEFT